MEYLFTLELLQVWHVKYFGPFNVKYMLSVFTFTADWLKDILWMK